MAQLNVRIGDLARHRLEGLAQGHGRSMSSVIETAIHVLHDMEGTLEHGFLNESEWLNALAALEGYQREPVPGRAVDFIRRFGFRLLETSRAWACVVDGRCTDPREAPPPPWLVPH
jgi:hypothetical protein